MSIFFPVPTCDVYPIEIASRTCWAFIQRVFFNELIKISVTPGEYVKVFGAISSEI